MARRANILNTESVKSYLAHAEFSESCKSKRVKLIPRVATLIRLSIQARGLLVLQMEEQESVEPEDEFEEPEEDVEQDW